MHCASHITSPFKSHASRWMTATLLTASIGATTAALAINPAFADTATQASSASATTQTEGAHAQPQVTRRVQVEGNIYEIAFDPKNRRLYAATVSNNVVGADGKSHKTPAGIVALDADTLEVVDRIDTGEVSPFGLAFNAETNKLYTTDTRAGDVAVFDADSGERTALIAAPEGQADHVRQVVVDPSTNTVYVSVVGGFSKGDDPAPVSTIWVIDGDTDELEHVIENPVRVATGLAIDPETRRLYVSDLANSAVAEIDADSHEVLRTFPAAPQAQIEDSASEGVMGGAGSVNLEIDPARGLLYVVNQKAGGVAVIDLEKGEVIDDISTGEGALSAKLNPRDGNLYVANRSDGTIAIIDGETRHVSAYLPGGSRPQTVAIAPESGVVYVSSKAKGRGRHAPDDVPTPYEPGGNSVIRIQP